MSENESLKHAIDSVKDQPLKTPEDIKHYGVLGMRWGVRRPVGSDGLVTGSVKSAMRNMKNLSNVRNKNLKNMSDSELKSRVDRVTKENRLKKLSRTSADKREYRNRGNLSDDELNKRVERLQLEANLRKESFKSNKQAIDAVNKILKESANMAVKELDEVKISENKNTDRTVKMMVKAATKKIRDGKAISNK